MIENFLNISWSQSLNTPDAEDNFGVPSQLTSFNRVSCSPQLRVKRMGWPQPHRTAERTRNESLTQAKQAGDPCLWNEIGEQDQGLLRKNQSLREALSVAEPRTGKPGSPECLCFLLWRGGNKESYPQERGGKRICSGRSQDLRWRGSISWVPNGFLASGPILRPSCTLALDFIKHLYLHVLNVPLFAQLDQWCGEFPYLPFPFVPRPFILYTRRHISYLWSMWLSYFTWVYISSLPASNIGPAISRVNASYYVSSVSSFHFQERSVGEGRSPSLLSPL